MASAILGVGLAHVNSGASAGPALQAWQLINIVGAPLLALLFLPIVANDLRIWIESRRSSDRRP